MSKLNSEITNTIYEMINKIIKEMNDGDNLKIKEIAEKIKQEIDLPLSTITTVATIALHQTQNIHIKAGRNGGVYKGELKNEKKDVRLRCETCNQTIRAKKD